MLVYLVMCEDECGSPNLEVEKIFLKLEDANHYISSLTPEDWYTYYIEEHEVC